MDFNSFPQPPKTAYNGQQVVSYTSDGKPIPTEVYPASSLGVNFSGLIGNQVSVPKVPVQDQIIPAEKKKRGKKKKNEETGETEIVVSNSNEVAPANSKEIVENTVYADTYLATNNMAYNIINQTDELYNECQQELAMIRSQRNLKGRYHYMNATVQSMGTLLSTKLAAIKEINNTIKTVNDNEYRRFKDMRAMDAGDDNKAIMDAYQAFISAPVGAPQYTLPGTKSLTGGLDGIIRADYPPEVQRGMDVGMANYIANMTPEENLMMIDNNKDIEEVILYDEATGVKKFQWMNTKTGEMLNNLPPSSTLTLEDFTIDPRLKVAKNTNLNEVKKVVILNEGQFDKF